MKRILLIATFLLAASRLLAQEPKLEIVIQRGHAKSATSGALSHDGKLLLTGSRDTSAILWDVATGRVLGAFRGGKGNAASVSFSRDGSRTLIVNLESGVSLWNTLTGVKVSEASKKGLYHTAGLSSDGSRALVQTGQRWLNWVDADSGNVIKQHEFQRVVQRLHLAPGGPRALAELEGDNECLVAFDPTTGETIRTWNREADKFTMVSMSTDGERLATGSRNGPLTTWDVATGKRLFTFPKFADDVRGFRLSPDGTKVLVEIDYHNLAVYDAATGKQLIKVERAVNSDHYGWSGDGKRVANFASTWQVWDATTGQELQKVKNRIDQATSVSLSGDGKHVAAGFRRNRAIVWDGVTGERRGPFFGNAENDSPATVGISHDGKRLLTDANDKSPVVWDPATGAKIATLRGHKQLLFSLALTPDARRAVTGSFDRTVIVWNAETGEIVKQLAPFGGELRTAISDDGKTIATANGERSDFIRLWNADTGAKLDDFPHDNTGTLAFSKTGRRLLLASYQNPSSIYDLTMKQALGVASYGGVGKGALVSNGQQALLATRYDHAIELWDIGAENPKRIFRGHSDEITALSLSADDRVLASCSEDGTVRLWDVASGKELCTLFTLNDDKDWLVVTPDGYFDGSVNAPQFLALRVQGTFDMISLDRFQHRYHKPGLLALIMSGKSPQAPAVPIAQALPPKIRILSPASGKLDDARVQITAVAEPQGKHPVTTFRLLLDGRPFQGQKGIHKVPAPMLGEARVNWSIELEPGPHTIKVLADTELTQGFSSDVSVTRPDPEAEVLLPSMYVFAVGISKYPGELKLNYAHKDAEAIAEVYKTKAKGLFKNVEVKLVLDEQATRGSIITGLKWLSKNMTQRDFGVFFFAGHGDKDSDGSLYFLPVDVDVKELAATGLSADDLKRHLAGIPGRLTAYLDACHSGGIDGGKKRNVRGLTDELMRDMIAEEAGLVVMCSATGREYALESNEHRHGLFTLALVEGLQGKADLNKDGVIYLHEIDAYVTERVKELSQGRQHPVTGKPTTIRSFPITKP